MQSRVVLGVALFTISATMLIAYFSMDTSTALFFDCTHWSLSYLLAAFLAYVSLAHSDQRDKKFKQWITCGLVSLVIGQIISNIQIVSGVRSFPGVADFFFLMLGLCSLGGLWFLMKNRLTPEQFRAIPFDIISITLSFVTLAIVLYFPLASNKNPIEIFLMVVYPVILLTASAIFVLFLLRSAPQPNAGWLFFLFGLSLQAFASMEWNELNFEKKLQNGHPLNFMFSISAVLMGLGVRFWHLEPTQNPRYKRYCDTLLRVVPLIAATFIASALLLMIQGDAILPQVRLSVVIAAIVVLIVIVIRQSLLLIDSELLRKAESHIQRLAFYDALTDLPNRRLLSERLRESIAAVARQGFYGAILFIDVDYFKRINDTKGHDYGDLLLIAIAHRLSDNISIDDTAARLGGDEFVVILSLVGETKEQASENAEKIATRLSAVINQPYMLKDSECICSVSVGIALFSGKDKSLEELLKRADGAMYKAKKAGRNRLHFYDERVVAELEARYALDNWMRSSMNKYYKLYYQVQIGRDHKIRGVEALLRLDHPQQGLLLPADFMPLAEETGLTISIGAWILTSACEQLKRWSLVNSLSQLPIAINISVRQFYDKDFLDSVRKTLDEVGIEPAKLVFELTEDLLLFDVDNSKAILEELMAMGIGISIDDFGAGQCSLIYLSNVRVHQLKIDQSFVGNLFAAESNQLVVRTIIAMADKLGFDVIADGVETQEQLDFLVANGCSNFQGHFFGAPVPIEEFEQVFAKVYSA
jgi:diguanylate cyclase (GGDEF)-like protein